MGFLPKIYLYEGIICRITCMIIEYLVNTFSDSYDLYLDPAFF
jgi:hypothetical protein